MPQDSGEDKEFSLTKLIGAFGPRQRFTQDEAQSLLRPMATALSPAPTSYPQGVLLIPLYEAERRIQTVVRKHGTLLIVCTEARRAIAITSSTDPRDRK